MGVGGASPTAGTSCATCLRKFTVHFRRSDRVGGKPRNNSTSHILKYNGDFGFDWLRDEYLNSIEMVGRIKTPILKQANNKNFVSKLKKNYTEGVRKISAFGSEYIPSHLAIFATNVDNENPNASKSINRDGALLSIEIHQLQGDDSTPLTDDGTELLFESNDPSIKISTSTGKEKKNRVKIQLKNFLSLQENRDLGKGGGVRKFYIKEDILRISCEGDTTRGATIVVKARKGNIEEEVGIMNIAANNYVPKARICLVNIRVNKNPINQPQGLEYRLKYQAFNQALIRADVVKKDDFDIFDLYVKHKSKDLENFLNKYYYHAKRLSDNNSEVDYNESENFKNDICALYQKYKKMKPINSDDTIETYVFFSNIRFKNNTNNTILLGSAVRGKEAGSDIVKWGNSVILTRDGSTDLETVVHEILHSFGVTHVFEEPDGEREYSFHKGFTDNFMDYKDTLNNGRSKYAEEPPTSNVKKSTPGNQTSLFRFQWNILRKDRSVQP